LFTWSFFYNICKEKKDEEIRLAKTTKACNSFYKALYFMGVTYWGYETLKDEIYLPVWLLGHGDLQNAAVGFPTYTRPPGLKMYYLGTMGYHVH